MTQNKDGFTLIEVMVAIIILMFGMLVLLNTAAVVMEKNLENVLRDEAEKIAESTMNQIRNIPFANLSGSSATENRNVRGVVTAYNVMTQIDTSPGPDTSIVQVIVSWTYKGKPKNHVVSTLMNRTL